MAGDELSALGLAGLPLEDADSRIRARIQALGGQGNLGLLLALSGDPNLQRAGSYISGQTEREQAHLQQLGENVLQRSIQAKKEQADEQRQQADEAYRQEELKLRRAQIAQGGRQQVYDSPQGPLLYDPKKGTFTPAVLPPGFTGKGAAQQAKPLVGAQATNISSMHSGAQQLGDIQEKWDAYVNAKGLKASQTAYDAYQKYISGNLSALGTALKGGKAPTKEEEASLRASLPTRTGYRLSQFGLSSPFSGFEAMRTELQKRSKEAILGNAVGHDVSGLAARHKATFGEDLTPDLATIRGGSEAGAPAGQAQAPDEDALVQRWGG